MRTFFRRLYELIERMARRLWDDKILQIGGSLTFTTLLSLVPVAAVVLSLLSAFPVFKGLSDTLEQWVFSNLMPDSADLLAKYGAQFVDNAAQLTAVGLLFLALTALMLLMTIDDAFNDIWRVRRARPMLRRVLIYWALILVGPVLMGASLSLSSWLMSASAGWTQGIPHASAVLIKCSAVALTALSLALLYYIMPNRPVRLRDALIGGVAAGVIFELTKHGFGYYITRFPTYTLVYGAFAAAPVFLLWVYLSWLVVLLGAVLAAALPEWRQHSAPGQHAPGSTFMHALHVLKVMWLAQRRGDGVSLAQLHEHLKAPFEHIETLLEIMQREGWVDRVAPAGWVLRRSAATLPVADVYRLFVFDPARAVMGNDPELARLAEAYAGRISGSAQISVAHLFDAGTAAPQAAQTGVGTNAAPVQGPAQQGPPS